MKKHLLLFLSLGLVFSNCKKNDDTVIEEEEIVEETGEELIEANITVQNFMWQTMNAYYFWQSDVNDLTDDRFSTYADYTSYLSDFPDPTDFFYDELLFSEDKFSYLSENYRDLLNAFVGISKSNGVEFGLSRFSDSDAIFGYVRYIVPNSDAASKEIKRGDIFTGVNGQTLTISNYEDLLFGDSNTYTLNMADIANNTITPNDREVVLTKEDNLVEDPLLVSKILEVSGQRIGYLMYNQFTGGSEAQLNQAFGEFKSAEITDLVLDLRYNLGGLGFTANVLASLIHSADEEELFYKVRYNDKIQGTLEPGFGETFFTATTGNANGNTNAPLNNLNLGRVFIIATDGSASSSELVMNSLAPYIEVVHIGTTTVGKNQGSATFVDDPGNGNVYDEERENNINPDNQWAIQPIIMLAENADGFSDYYNGLVPNIELEEDIENMGVLGDINEPLLARTLQEITGASAKRTFNVHFPVNLITSSKMFTPMKDNLIIEKVPTALKSNLAIPFKNE
ncbi:S41 family peptidase [uncultured Kriegella sp.]|uniref:S41 family peptidase n=1 Tax=uncultured Kriegella sp. TaxID=1798910 RepID=UPI0030D8A487|tara:strand:+ start:441532 stop:443061 length:1530 start_codon:yes stop_codon:yes gene_type:complete